MSEGCWGWFLRNILRHDGEYIPINSRVIHVSSEYRFREIIESSKCLVIVYFSTPRLNTCRHINTVFHELSVTYPETKFLKVDVDELKNVYESCDVVQLPTFQFYRHGDQCDEMRGTDRKELEIRIQRHMVDVELLEEECADVDKKNLSNNDTERMRKHKLEVEIVTSVKHWEHLLQQNQRSSKVYCIMPISAIPCALIVQFWATWCKPCKNIKPFFEELRNRFPAALFAYVDVDELESVTEAFDVTSLPCFKVFTEGKVVDEMCGAIFSALEDMVTRHCAIVTC
ncbi:putative thioredoxin [Plasmopara halstedii]